MTKLINIDDIIDHLTANSGKFTQLVFDASQDIDLEDLQRIVAALKDNTTVTCLSFLDNHLTSEHIRLIGSIDCRSLIELSLQNNNISDIDLDEILKIKTLQAMNLSYNKIEDPGACLLASYPNLIELNVNYNRIGQTGMSALISSNKLLRLYAEQNSVDASIADQVFANTSLRNVQLRNRMIDRNLQLRFNQHTAHNSQASQIGLFPPGKSPIDKPGDEKKNDNGQTSCIVS